MNRPPTTYADQMGMAVTYMGENMLGQFAFGNGSPLATDVFASLPEAAKRFGARIDTRDKEYTRSGPFKAGLEAAKKGAPYAPDRKSGRQAILEYGCGYLKGLKE